MTIDKGTAIDNVYAAAESIICAVEEGQPEIVDIIVDVRDAILKKIEEQQTAESRQVLTKTNADRIRQMTDEELAEWFAPNMMCNLCDKKDKPDGCNQEECMKYALIYMKKEVSEDAGTD